MAMVSEFFPGIEPRHPVQEHDVQDRESVLQSAFRGEMRIMIQVRGHSAERSQSLTHAEPLAAITLRLWKTGDRFDASYLTIPTKETRSGGHCR